MSNEDEYTLGNDTVELERLGSQHFAWLESMLGLVSAARFRAGDRLIDLGCGPGFTSEELAKIAGSAGRVFAIDRSERFVRYLESECARRGLHHIEPMCSSVESLELPDSSIDGAYARWLFCWLQDPEPALREAARVLKPGAAIAIQDYVDWAAMKMIPKSAAYDVVASACMNSWAEGGLHINITERLIELAPRLGFEVETFSPVGRLGAVGSLEWNWLGDFFRSYLPRLVERGGLSTSAFEAWKHDWDERQSGGQSFVLTPTVANLLLRKR